MASPRTVAGRSALGTPTLAVALTVLLAALPALLAAPQEKSAEIVATFATGRVVFCVAHDAILVAAVEGEGQAGSLPPSVVPVSSERIGVLLGAVEWSTPDSGAKPMRLDAELPPIAATATRRPAEKILNQPSEIEDIGVGMLQPVRQVAAQIHHKLDLAPDQPIVELLLADYVEDYGPEIWSLQYRIRQEALGNDYWTTTVLRPAYYQLYPPEKDHSILVEVRYPGKLPQPTLAERLAQHDPELERIRNATDLSQATDAILAGKSDKAAPGPVADFLRAALPVVAGTQDKLVLAELDAIKGFKWLLPPQEALPAPTQTNPSDPGAPSLRKFIPPK